MRHELHKEQLTALPKRFETRRINVVLLGQSNYNVQAIGVGLFNQQNSYQSNFALISQR